jgi:hypothetical protein
VVYCRKPDCRAYKGSYRPANGKDDSHPLWELIKEEYDFNSD